MHVVIKPFPWSPNGIQTEDLKVGDSRDFGSATQGLLDEKFIGQPEQGQPEQGQQEHNESDAQTSGLNSNAGEAAPADDAGNPASPQDKAAPVTTPAAAPAPAPVKSGKKGR